MLFSFVFCINKWCEYTDGAISSMLAQDYSYDYEIIVVANNCEDDVYNKIKKIEQESNKLKLYRTDIGQLAFNLNYAANLARGEYLVRMDSDDFCYPDRLKKTHQKLIENDFPDVICGGARFINEDGCTIKTVSFNASTIDVIKMLPRGNCLIHPCTAIKKSSLLKVRGYAGGIVCEDYDLWLRMARDKFEFRIFSELLIDYRVHSQQSRGNLNGPADGAGYMIRELILTNNFSYFLGFLKRLSLCVFLKVRKL